MIASQVALTTFLTQNRTQFVIPVYQRNYDWLEPQCRQLLNDILEVGNRASGDTHFIGSIVFIHDGVYTTQEVKQLVIIDGQQRLTTVTLLYLALYKYAITQNMLEKATEINETILINRFVTEDSSKLKLKPTDNNSKAIRYLMGENDPLLYPEYSRIIENYNYFFKHIDQDTFPVIMRGLSRLLFVEISLERGKDDPQRIFESLNSTGLELSQADLIRNYILMGLNPREQNQIFHDYWEVIENNAKIDGSEESKVSDLIRDYLTYKNKKIPNKNKVYEEFKNRYRDRGQEFYDSTLRVLRDYSLIYNRLLNPDRETDVEIRRELKRIHQLEINVAYPFLIPVYSDYNSSKITKEQFLEILRITQAFTWRRFIVGLPTNALNKIFMTLYGEINERDYVGSIVRSLVKKRGSQRYPNNKEIEQSLKDKDLYNIQSKNRNYFFELMEHHNNRERIDVLSADITIEHIFPRNPDDRWKDDLSAEEYKSLSEKYLHTAANLTLSGNNGSLGNKPFTEKKNMNKDGGEQGYLYSNFWLNRYLKTIERWGMSELEARFTLIYKRFLEVWPYPVVEGLFDDREQEYTLFDAPDPSHRKLEYFIFRDEKIITEEVSKMYYHVIRTLFAESPTRFLLTDLKESVGISTDASALRMAYAINDSYFVESKINNTGKFRKLKAILQHFELEDELLIRYASVG